MPEDAAGIAFQLTYSVLRRRAKMPSVGQTAKYWSYILQQEYCRHVTGASGRYIDIYKDIARERLWVQRRTQTSVQEEGMVEHTAAPR